MCSHQPPNQWVLRGLSIPSLILTLSAGACGPGHVSFLGRMLRVAFVVPFSQKAAASTRVILPSGLDFSFAPENAVSCVSVPLPLFCATNSGATELLRLRWHVTGAWSSQLSLWR